MNTYANGTKQRRVKDNSERMQFSNDLRNLTPRKTYVTDIDNLAAQAANGAPIFIRQEFGCFYYVDPDCNRGNLVRDVAVKAMFDLKGDENCLTNPDNTFSTATQLSLLRASKIAYGGNPKFFYVVPRKYLSDAPEGIKYRCHELSIETGEHINTFDLPDGKWDTIWNLHIN